MSHREDVQIMSELDRKSQCELLKAHFDKGGSLTVLEALEAPFRIYALSQRCGNLAKAGYPVESEWVTLPNKKRIKRYFKRPARDLFEFIQDALAS